MSRLFSLVLATLIALPAACYADDEDVQDDKKPKEEAKKSTGKSEIAEILDSMGYPELQVVPRASERIALEAKMEDSTFLVTHWPIEIVALATLYSGMTAKGRNRSDLTAKEKKDSTTIGAATTAIGAGWLAGSILLGGQRPYYRGKKSLEKYTGKDERSALLRERLAEEALEKPAKTMRVLQNIAVITCAGANLATGIHGNESGVVIAGVTTLLSFLPWMFEDHNISVYDKHIEYKKKIYAPLKSASFFYDPYSKTLTPVSQLTWTF